MTSVDSRPPAALGETTGALVFRGGLWGLLSGIVPQLQILALSIVAARYLGPDGMGRQSFIAFVALSLALAATAGLPPALARFVAELLGAGRGGQALSLARWTRRLQTLTGLLAGGVLVLAALLGADPRLAWVLAGVGIVFAVLQSVPAAVLTGAQRWREVVGVGLVTGVASVPLAIAVLAAGGGIVGFFAVETGVLLVNLLWTSALARRLARDFPPFEPAAPAVYRRFLSFAAMATAIAAIEFVVWRRSEFFLLDWFSSDAQLAYYSIGFAAAAGLSRLPGAMTRVTMPAVATMVGADDRARIRTGYWRAVRMLLLLTLPLTALLAATGPALIDLAYGSDFSSAGDVLLVLLVPLPLVPLITTSSALLFGLGRPRFLMIVGIAASVVNIALALVLVPALDAVGAAIANAIGQVAAGGAGARPRGTAAAADRDRLAERRVCRSGRGGRGRGGRGDPRRPRRHGCRPRRARSGRGDPCRRLAAAPAGPGNRRRLGAHGARGRSPQAPGRARRAFRHTERARASHHGAWPGARSYACPRGRAEFRCPRPLCGSGAAGRVRQPGAGHRQQAHGPASHQGSARPDRCGAAPDRALTAPRRGVARDRLDDGQADRVPPAASRSRPPDLPPLQVSIDAGRAERRRSAGTRRAR